ncbi:MAG: GNAT family N-acetyltransferase [Oscillospiraceae bacterium]|nr:GNAT family N-acetyltransferase [Oscillospiraceae bacterium]
MLQYHRTTEAEIKEICGWRYEGAYAVYDSAPYEEQRRTGKGFFNPKNHYYSFCDGERLVGYINLVEKEEGIFLGAAANPALCGRGYGQRMIRAACEIAQKEFGGKPPYLEVRTWNERAVRCYEKAGFQIDGAAFSQTTPLGEGSFFRMKKPV